MTVSEHVVHLTTTHSIDDARVVRKVCTTLAEAGHHVDLIGVGLPTQQLGRIAVTGVGTQRGRWWRAFVAPFQLWKSCKQLRPAVVHIHEPELLLLVPLFRLHGTPIIYDTHEDLPRLIRSRQSIPPALRPAASRLVTTVERIAARRTHVISAEPAGMRRFTDHGIPAALVQNFPVLEEFDSGPPGVRTSDVCYVGGLTRERGSVEMVRAIGLVPDFHDARLRIAGHVRNEALAEELAATPGWDRVEQLGWIDRPAVSRLLASVSIGLAVLHPTDQYRDATQPVKLFEYMAAGLPVVASDFPKWRDILETEDGPAGVFVDPLDAQAIADAISGLLHDRPAAEEMGRRGRVAVERRYQWRTEGRRLLEVYDSILGRSA